MVEQHCKVKVQGEAFSLRPRCPEPLVATVNFDARTNPVRAALQRQPDDERGALADLALDLDSPPVRLDDLLGYPESQTHPLLARLGALEPIENPFQIFARNADPLVPHLDSRFAAL